MTTPATPTTPPPPQLLSVDELPQIFSDLVPIEQPPSTVCQIQYKADFAMAYNYFRGLLQQCPDEASDRALQLTELCASMNPSNYTVWQHRRTIYRKLWQMGDKEVTTVVEGEEWDTTEDPDGPDDDGRLWSRRVRYELDLAARLGGANPKTYQVWYHRRAVVEHLREVAISATSAAAAAATSKADVSGSDDVGRLIVEVIESELEYLKEVVKVDGKNYHAWSHRQFLVAAMAGLRTHDGTRADMFLLLNEISYTAHLLRDDVRNNSAWNHRWFVVTRMLDEEKENQERRGNPAADSDASIFEEQMWDRETSYALAMAKRDPYNESPWRYFVAGVRRHVRRLGKEGHETQRIRRDALALYEREAWNVMPGYESLADAVLDSESTMGAAAAAAAAAAVEGGEEEGLVEASAALVPDADAVSPHLLAAVVDLLELALEVVDGGNIDSDTTSTKPTSPSARAAHLCRCLETIDPIRQKYWRRRGAQVVLSGRVDVTS